MVERNTVPCIEKELNGLSQLSCHYVGSYVSHGCILYLLLRLK